MNPAPGQWKREAFHPSPNPYTFYVCCFLTQTDVLNLQLFQQKPVREEKTSWRREGSQSGKSGDRVVHPSLSSWLGDKGPGAYAPAFASHWLRAGGI